MYKYEWEYNGKKHKKKVSESGHNNNDIIEIDKITGDMRENKYKKQADSIMKVWTFVSIIVGYGISYIICSKFGWLK